MAAPSACSCRRRECSTVEWRDIPGFEGFYQAGEAGSIRSCERIVKSTRHRSGWKTVRARVLKPHDNGRGYLEVCLYDCEDNRIKAKVHHLVAVAFLGPWPDGAECVRHRDDVRKNNRYTNLVYGTLSQNVADSISLGRFTRGELNGVAKLVDSQVSHIKRRLLDGERTGILAREFGVAPSTICDIKAERNWAHIQAEQVQQSLF